LLGWGCRILLLLLLLLLLLFQLYTLQLCTMTLIHNVKARVCTV
jgi:hypothetical protein